jgi:queuine tRNA-ribosyltransferase
MGRTGALYTRYGKINILNAKYIDDFSSIDAGCGCYTCTNFTRAYLAHLFRAKEMLAGTLASLHNLYFISRLVDSMRQAIYEEKFDALKNAFLSEYVS